MPPAEKTASSSVAYNTMRLSLIGLAIDLVLTVLLLVVHAVNGSPVIISAIPYFAAGILLFTVVSLLSVVIYCYLCYPKFRKSIIFILVVTSVVLLVHLALISDPPTSYSYYVNGNLVGTVPISQIPHIPVCSNGYEPSSGCEQCSGCVMDESYYVPAASTIIDGIHCASSVEGCNMEHPPLSKALIAVGLAAFGSYGLQWSRLLPIILGTACIPLIFAIAWSFSKNKKIAYYASILLALDTMFFVHSSISVIDIPFIFFGLAGAAAYLYNVKFWFANKYIIAGALMGLSVLSKETAVFLVAALVTFHLLRGKEPLTRRILTSIEIAAVAFIVFAVGLQIYDSLLTGGQVPTFWNQIEYIYTYGKSLICHPSAFNCPGAFQNVPGNSATAITPLSWFVYYVPTTYFATSVSVCTGSVCQSYKEVAYYGVTNMVEIWTTYIWVPLAAYVLYRLLRRKGVPQLSGKSEPKPMAMPLAQTAATALSMDDIEKISRLKLLMDSGAITKEEFESQKATIMRTGGRTPVVVEEKKPDVKEAKVPDPSVSSSAVGRFSEIELPVFALIFLCWNYLPYLYLAFVEGRVTYPFYLLPAIPAIALGVAYLISRPFFPRALAIVFLVGVFIWFFVYFPDKSFLPTWIRAALGT